jgi:hypothetical protein
MSDLLEEVNGTIRSLAARVDPQNSSIWQFVCECGTAECGERVRLSLARYDALRDSDGALVAPGHPATTRL